MTHALFTLATLLLIALYYIRRERLRNGHALASHMLMQNTSEGVLLFGPDFRIQHANRGASRLTGFSMNNLANVHLQDLLSHNPIGCVEEIRRELALLGSWTGEVEMRRRPQTSFAARVTIDCMPKHSKDVSYACVFSDIAVQKKIATSLLHLSLYDPLTGLMNRAHFMVCLEQALEHLVYSPKELALLFIDMDNLKQVNDQWGHGVGDLFLKEAAQRLRSCTRSTTDDAKVGQVHTDDGAHLIHTSMRGDLVARIGGDEFAVLIECPQGDSALRCAERICQTLNQPWQYEDCKLVFGASIGIAYAPHDSAVAIELLQFADQAMYQIKKQGKGSISEYRRQPHRDQKRFKFSQLTTRA